MDLTTAVGRELARRFLGSPYSGETAEETRLRHTIGDGVSRADALLSRVAAPESAISRDTARVARVIEEISFQTDILAIQAALDNPGVARDRRPS